ncbi:MAG: glycogen debranching enzyme N-terminal domain-containing protein, partial [Chitinophagales bacterium]|nr:glycogen debranching enzyme N-terminal domain-containing protein [Chitinophagales bacterium]
MPTNPHLPIMSYIEFDKTQLVNLNYSLTKELLRANRSGAFACTTIINCNTRKYHGLLIVRQPQLDDDYHVLLSSVDETVTQHNASFHLGIHKYPGKYYPGGHKYLEDFTTDPIPKLTYRVGGVVLTREHILVTGENRILLRYTLVDAHSPTLLRLNPFLAFRGRHSLSHANTYLDKKYDIIENGVSLCLYEGYDTVYMQVSKKTEFIPAPDWYYNIEYIEEKARGYEYLEDLYVPGYFEVPIKKGESIILSASTSLINPKRLSAEFKQEVERRPPRNSFRNCLRNSAQQFITEYNGKTEIIAGYPWFGAWGRDTFIALPGLTLSQDDPKTFKAAIDSILPTLRNGLFPNMGLGEAAQYNSADAPLWFIWAMQQYAQYTQKPKALWKEYAPAIQAILYAYRNGTSYNIAMHDNALIFAGEPGYALTWMDAVVDGVAVTPRIGMPVEINALWYNAVCFALEMAKASGDKAFIAEWQDLPPRIAQNFMDNFWDESKGYLADFTNGIFRDWSVRPNQIIAVSLPYSPVAAEYRRQSIIDRVRKDLLTPRG